MNAGTAGGPVLVLNAGSSSLKFAVFEGFDRTLSGEVEGIGTRPRFSISAAKPAASTAAAKVHSEPESLPAETHHAEALTRILAALQERGVAADRLAACGHRIVHGGVRFVAPLLVRDDNLDALNALRELAPLHNIYGLDAIAAIRREAPTLPQIACFDTAFHANIPDIESRYALPADLHEAGFRRFGFHGLNYEHVTAAVAKLAGRIPRRLLIFHLGNGSSICAVKDGRSVATTMGYSTLDGLVMGTRCGAIDPGVLIALQRERGLSVKDLEDLLYRHCGLLGLSGRTSDMRDLLEGDGATHTASRFAVDHFCYWAARHAGSLAVALDGIDAIAFSGGIGSGSAAVRAYIMAHLKWLGLDLDDERNRRQDETLTPTGSRHPIWRIEANEELAIVRHVHAIIGRS